MFIFVGLQVSIVGLERALHQYTLEPSETPFDLKTVPLAVQPTQEMKTGNYCVCVCVCVCARARFSEAITLI